MKKWLSYREKGAGHASLLGRGLKPSEAREFTALALRLDRRRTARPRAGRELEAVISDTFDWQTTAAAE